MTARPGKTLPSVIVGGLMAGAMALGMGTAHADDPVSPLDPITSAVAPLAETECLLNGVPVTMGIKYARQAGSTDCELVRPTPTPDQTPPAATQDGNASTAPSNNGPTVTPAQQRATEAAARQRAADDAAAQQRAAQDAAARQAAAQAVASAAAPVPTVGLTSPSSFGSAPGGLLTGLPGGAAGFGAYNPGLLLAPAGSPLRTLTGQGDGSPVTTASQVQSMAFDNLPGGLGTPSVLGVLILASLGAFALRHRILSRARAAADADARPEDDAPDATEARTVETAGV